MYSLFHSFVIVNSFNLYQKTYCYGVLYSVPKLEFGVDGNWKIWFSSSQGSKLLTRKNRKKCMLGN